MFFFWYIRGIVVCRVFLAQSNLKEMFFNFLFLDQISELLELLSLRTTVCSRDFFGGATSFFFWLVLYFWRLSCVLLFTLCKILHRNIWNEYLKIFFSRANWPGKRTFVWKYPQVVLNQSCEIVTPWGRSGPQWGSNFCIRIYRVNI